MSCEPIASGTGGPGALVSIVGPAVQRSRGGQEQGRHESRSKAARGQAPRWEEAAGKTRCDWSGRVDRAGLGVDQGHRIQGHRETEA